MSLTFSLDCVIHLGIQIKQRGQVAVVIFGFGVVVLEPV